MTIAFRDYLDIKAALDDRSLNPAVRAAFHDALRGREWLACLDLGTGAGASLWRLLNANLAASLSITAVDRDADLLALAFRRTLVLFRARGYEVATSGDLSLRARRADRQIAIDFVHADSREFDPRSEMGRFDAVMAQESLDFLALDTLADRIGRWLKPKGVFYATLNYQGGTCLFPSYRDPEAEAGILAAYEAALERRWGRDGDEVEPGQRLYDALQNGGFEVVAYGSSDWNLSPVRRAYRDQAGLCLATLLEMVRDEVARSGTVPASALGAWYVGRLQDVEHCKLGLIVRQLDLLAQKI